MFLLATQVNTDRNSTEDIAVISLYVSALFYLHLNTYRMIRD